MVGSYRVYAGDCLVEQVSLAPQLHGAMNRCAHGKESSFHVGATCFNRRGSQHLPVDRLHRMLGIPGTHGRVERKDLLDQMKLFHCQMHV